MENGHPEQTQRSKSTKKKKRKRERENELEHPIDTQETLQNGSFQVNSEEASTANVDDIVEKDLAEEEAHKSKSSKKKKKKRKREHENDVEIAPDSQESQQTDGTQVYSLDAPTADTEKNGPAGEGSPKKKRKKEQKEDKVTDQPNSDEKPPNKGTKSKAKKPPKVKDGLGLAYPHQILDMEKEFLSTHKDERFADKAARFLTPENRALMRKNWNEFFQDHPYPQPTVLLRQKDKHDENTLKEVESFIRENDFYKHLVQGIDDHPRRIIRTAIRFYPYRKAMKKQKMEEVFSANPSVPPLRENEPPTLQEVLRLSGDSSLWELLRRTYTDLECTWIYHATLKQVKCKLWHKHRVGRITASRMHRIYNFMTSGKTVLTPSITKDTMRHMSPRQCGKTWGERMESVAIGDYVKRMSLLHDDLRVLPCGLWVNPEMNLPKLPKDMAINRDWSEEDNIIFRDFIVEEMAGQENTAAMPFAKVKTKIPGMPAQRCRTQWKNVTCWQIDNKWQVRPEPFGADDKKKLVEGVRDQGVASEDEINWKKLSREFPNSNRKELKYYWTNLIKLNRLHNLPFQDALQQLIQKVNTQKQRVPAIAKTNKTKFDKLQMRKEVLQRMIVNMKSKISALQTRLEKTEGELADVMENLDKMKEYGTDEIPPASEEVDPEVDTTKSKTVQPKTTPAVQGVQSTVTKSQKTPKAKTKSVSDKAQESKAPNAPKTKKAKVKSATIENQDSEAPDATKPKKAKASKSVTVENQDTATPDAPKNKKSKVKSATIENQDSEAPDATKPKKANASKSVTVENQDIATPDATKTKKAKTKNGEGPGSPKPKDGTKTKSGAETPVDAVSESFMDTSINHMSRFFDDDDEL